MCCAIGSLSSFLQACGLPKEKLQVMWEKFHGEVVPIKDHSLTLKDTGLHRRSKVSFVQMWRGHSFTVCCKDFGEFCSAVTSLYCGLLGDSSSQTQVF